MDSIPSRSQPQASIIHKLRNIYHYLHGEPVIGTAAIIGETFVGLSAIQLPHVCGGWIGTELALPRVHLGFGQRRYLGYSFMITPFTFCLLKSGSSCFH